RRKRPMRNWLALGAISAACLVALAAPVAAVQDKDERSAQERTKAEKELRDLESQREKLDSKIREIRRSLGRDRQLRIDRDVTVPRVEVRELKGLTEEQRKEVEKAMELAHKSVRDSLKNLPDNIVIPDISGIVDKELRHFID